MIRLGSPPTMRHRAEAGARPVLTALLLLATFAPTPAAAPPLASADASGAGEPAAAHACLDGMAGGHPCAGLDLLAHLPLEAFSSRPGKVLDVWGRIDPASGREYALVGLDNGVTSVDVTDPSVPFEADFRPGFSESLAAAFGESVEAAAPMSAGASYEARLEGAQIGLWRLADGSAPGSRVGALPTPDPGGALSLSPAEDGHHLFVHDDADETERGLNTTVHVLDLEHPTSPVPAGTWTGATRAVDRGGHALGNRLYLANHTRGLTVLDITDPLRPTEAGFFDTAPGADGPERTGTVAVFPFLPGGTVLAADAAGGLYVLRDRTRAPPQGALAFAAEAYGGQEGEVVTIAVERQGGAEGAASVDYAVVPGSADGADLEALTGRLHWSAGESGMREIDIHLLSDGLPEGLERTWLRLARPSGGAALGARFMAPLFIGDAGSPGEVGFARATWTVDGDGRVALTVERRGNPMGEASVEYEVRGGGLVAAGHLGGPASGRLVWPDGDAGPRTIFLQLPADALRYRGQTFTVMLHSAAGARLAGEVATLRLARNQGVSGDTSVPLGGEGDSSAALSAGAKRIVATTTVAARAAAKSGPAAQAVSQTFDLPRPHAWIGDGALAMWGYSQDIGKVDPALVENGDAWIAIVKVEVDRVELELAATQSGPARGEGENPGPDLSSAFETRGRLTLRFGDTELVLDTAGIDDREPYLWEADGEAFINAVDNQAGAVLVLEVLEGEAEEAPPPELSIADAAEVGEGGTAEFTVTLAGERDGEVTVDWATADGTAQAGEDYTAASGTLTFPADAASRTVEVAILDDSLDEPAETFTVTLSKPAGATLANGSATGTIADDDEPLPAAPTDGDDTLAGTSGDDTINGMAGDDTIRGGGGNDALEGGKGADALYGEAGDDRLKGGAGDDVLDGGAGADVLKGAKGDDRLDGGEGRDRLNGGAGDDTLTGGAGADTFVYGEAAFGADTVTDFEDGTDRIDLRGSGLGFGDLTITASHGGAVISRTGGRAAHHITLAGVAAPDIDRADFLLDPELSIADAAEVGEGGTAEFTVTLAGERTGEVTVDWATADGTAKADEDYAAASGTLTFLADDERRNVEVATLYDSLDESAETFTVILSAPTGATLAEGSATCAIADDDEAPPAVPSDGDDTLAGTGGNDIIRGGDGNDILEGGKGDDALSGEAGQDRLKGGAGDDVLDGGAGADVLKGAKGDDQLAGGRGGDRLNGGAGDDTLTGGAGADTFVYADAAFGTDRITDFEVGVDRIDLRGSGIHFSDLEMHGIGRHTLIVHVGPENTLSEIAVLEVSSLAESSFLLDPAPQGCSD